MPSRGVFLMTGDPATERSVLDALRTERGLTVENSVRTLPELIRHMNGSPPPVVLVDVDPQPERTLALLDPIISRFSDTRFVVLGASPRPELLIEAMQVGARHFLAKESISTDLVSVLNRIVPSSALRKGSNGAIISVLSASGGTGATLLAVNLANELCLGSKAAVLLVDMDPCCGAAASYLGVEPSIGLDTLLADPKRLDGELLKSSAAVYSDTLHIIASPSAALRSGVHIPYQNLRTFLDAAKDEFGFTLVDAPRLPLDITSEVGVASHLTLLPFQQTVVGIKHARKLLDSLVGHGVPSDTIVPVISRYRKRGVLVRYEDACRALGRPSLGMIENDWEGAAESTNFGAPLSKHAPRSGLRKSIAAVAAQLQKARESGGGYTLTW
jgi:pilus assembly protein CpaE